MIFNAWQVSEGTGNSFDVNADGRLMRKVALGHQSAGDAVADVRLWLSQAQHLRLTNPTTENAIRFLENLLTALIPKETALLTNYPNPFNPETWIPYQLAETIDVEIVIYDARGDRPSRSRVVGFHTLRNEKSVIATGDLLGLIS